MVEARRAPVRPRVRPLEGGAVRLLEEEVQSFLEDHQSGTIALTGPGGSGKTTALAHLAAILDPCPTLIDDLESTPAVPPAAVPPKTLWIYATRVAWAGSHLAKFELVPWDSDDAIEYLLSRDKDRCASVMRRLRPGDVELLGGVPELWSVVLDELAGDASLPDAHAALYRYLQKHLAREDVVEWAGSVCLVALTRATQAGASHPDPPPLSGFPERARRFLPYRAVQLILAAERIAKTLRDQSGRDLTPRWPRDLLTAVVRAIGDDPGPLKHVQELLAGALADQAMAASLVLALDPAWIPKPGTLHTIQRAYLGGARWRGVQLPRVQMSGVDLALANLQDADLRGARLAFADMSGACLQGACLAEATAEAADLTDADLTKVDAARANFSGVKLEDAILTDAVLDGVSFVGATLTRACLQGARLAGAKFAKAIIEDTDFSGADLTVASMAGLRLCGAEFTDAHFNAADLRKCDLEGMHLPQANFENANLAEALLTSTVMPGANLRSADLRNAGLADIDWEGADLRGADLRGASFHLGSSRSGLVNSPLACEGSRTGFYTDEFEEQYYKAPEEIRKANLCGADLRGAQLDQVDFYLVDLRGAQLDADQVQHARRCGAIFECRG